MAAKKQWGWAPKQEAQMLSDRFYEMWGLTFEGGEERTYSIMPQVAKLEAVVEAARLHTEADWEFDPRHSLGGLSTWGAVLKALKEL